MYLRLMVDYNKLITRFKKAEEYFAREDVSLENKELFIPNCKELINELDAGLKNIIANGYEMTSEEILEGFRQVKFLMDKGEIKCLSEQQD